MQAPAATVTLALVLEPALPCGLHITRMNGARTVQAVTIPPWIIPLSPPVTTSATPLASGVREGLRSASTQPAAFPEVMETWPIGHPPAVEDDAEMAVFDYLGFVPEVVVDLELEIQDPGVNPTSLDKESNTDVLPPPTVAVVEVDVAVKEISRLLEEIPFGTATSFGGVRARGKPQTLDVPRQGTTAEWPLQ